MTITTLEVACGEQHKETVAAVLEHLRQHFTDLHNAAQNSSMSEKTLKPDITKAALLPILTRHFISTVLY